jgi:hypothetical protein
VRVPLVNVPIPPNRNPVPSLGVKNTFSTLELRKVQAAGPNPMLALAEDRLSLSLTSMAIERFGWSVCEAADGSGDFSLRADESLRKKSASLWFWGYANQHGVDGF